MPLLCQCRKMPLKEWKNKKLGKLLLKNKVGLIILYFIIKWLENPSDPVFKNKLFCLELVNNKDESVHRYAVREGKVIGEREKLCSSPIGDFNHELCRELV